MQIENLTPEQVEMLDFMWNELDSEQEFLDWYECLDPAQQAQADLLQRLVIIEAMDEEMLQKNNNDFAEANAVIDRFRL